MRSADIRLISTGRIYNFPALGNMVDIRRIYIAIETEFPDRIFDLGLLFAWTKSINALRQKRKDTIEESTTRGDGVLIEIVIIS